MNNFEALAAKFKKGFPTAQFDEDIPENSTGEHWLNMVDGERELVLVWKGSTNEFGLYLNPEDSPFSNPDEIYSNIDEIFDRVTSLVRGR